MGAVCKCMGKGDSNFPTHGVDITSATNRNIWWREWAIAGVFWDLNNEYPDSIYNVLETSRWEFGKNITEIRIDSMAKLYNRIKESTDITNKSKICEAFRNHGFDPTEWDSSC